MIQEDWLTGEGLRITEEVKQALVRLKDCTGEEWHWESATDFPFIYCDKYYISIVRYPNNGRWQLEGEHPGMGGCTYYGPKFWELQDATDHIRLYGKRYENQIHLAK